MSVTSFGFGAEGMRSEHPHGARWQRGDTRPRCKTKGLHGMRYRRGTAAWEKASCQPEAWRKVSEETDGSRKAAKGQNYNIMTVSEKEWHSAINL